MRSDSTLEPLSTLPARAQDCQARIDQLSDAISALRIELATADADRQARRKRLDAQWYQQVSSALHQKKRELAALRARLKELTREDACASDPRARFKDALIEALRAECDAATWQMALERARVQCAVSPVQNPVPVPRVPAGVELES